MLKKQPTLRKICFSHGNIDLFCGTHNAENPAVIDPGKVAETGSHNQLIATENGIYKNLNALQFEMM